MFVTTTLKIFCAIFVTIILLLLNYNNSVVLLFFYAVVVGLPVFCAYMVDLPHFCAKVVGIPLFCLNVVGLTLHSITRKHCSVDHLSSFQTLLCKHPPDLVDFVHYMYICIMLHIQLEQGQPVVWCSCMCKDTSLAMLHMSEQKLQRKRFWHKSAIDHLSVHYTIAAQI